MLGFKNIVNIARILIVGAGAIFVYRKLQQQQQGSEQQRDPNRRDRPSDERR